MRGRPAGQFLGEMTLPGRPGESLLYLFFIAIILNKSRNYLFFSESSACLTLLPTLRIRPNTHPSMCIGSEPLGKGTDSVWKILRIFPSYSNFCIHKRTVIQPCAAAMVAEVPRHPPSHVLDNRPRYGTILAF